MLKPGDVIVMHRASDILYTKTLWSGPSEIEDVDLGVVRDGDVCLVLALLKKGSTPLLVLTPAGIGWTTPHNFRGVDEC